MSLSTPFIHRPIATMLLTLGLALVGAVSYFLLPVAPLPQVDYPTISVSASLPGASPDTVAATVATPLERALGSIAGVNEITSRSILGSTNITLQFDLSRDVDSAARDVQAAINAARSLLPTGMPSNPTYRKVNPADSPIMILALTSGSLTRGQMYDAASTVLAQKLSQVEGVGQATVSGGALPAVRVSLDPVRLAANGVSLEQVRSAISTTNANRPLGAVEREDHYWQIAANDQARVAADYAPLVLRWKDGNAIRLSDVADVTDSVQDVRNFGVANGKPAILLQVFKQPGANILEAVDRVRALLPQLQASIPAAIDIEIVSDRTPTLRASVKEVENALVIAVGLVILVVFLFLRNARATLIPAVAVPPGTNWVLTLPLNALPGAENLVAGTLYYSRISAQDLRGLSSAWSAGLNTFQFGIAPPRPGTITAFRRGANGQMTLEWTGAAGRVFVEFSHSLNPPQWYTVAGPLTGTNWTFLPVPGTSSGFYRLRSE